MALSSLGGGTKPAPNAIVFSHDGREIEVKNPSAYGNFHISELDAVEGQQVEYSAFNQRIETDQKTLADISTDPAEQAQLRELASQLSTEASAATCTVSA